MKVSLRVMWTSSLLFLLLVPYCCGKRHRHHNISIVHESIKKTLSTWNIRPTAVKPIGYEYTEMVGVCDRFVDDNLKKKSVCCTPNDVRHIYNVLIEDRKLIFFDKEGSPRGERTSLPPVVSVSRQVRQNLDMVIEHRNEPMDVRKHCMRYFNGTLHVVGRATVHNVYHACKTYIRNFNFFT